MSKLNLLHKKITAAILLLSLLFINVLQTAHSHSNSNHSQKVCTAKQYAASTEKTSIHADVSCFFCEHQFVKHFDNSVSFLELNPILPFYKKELNPTYNSSVYKIARHFETRGPPSFA